jgi:hypothetical protein
MNAYTAIVDYLRASAPPGGFTVFGLGRETEKTCQALQGDLGARWTAMAESVDVLAALRSHGKQNHYDVMLVPPVLHRHKNWYEYLEAIVALADIVIFDTVIIEGCGGAEAAYAHGIQNELRKMGDEIRPCLYVVNKNKLQGEEAQAAMVEEILRGFDANTTDEQFHISDSANYSKIAAGLVTALRYHGWVLNYDPAITAANLNQVIAQTPIPKMAVPLKPERH